MKKNVDSYRFIGGVTARMVKKWIKMESPRPIPWTPLEKPLSECKIALLTSAGIALKNDRPFDQEGERQDPWWGDPSYRIIPPGTSAQDIRAYHLHIDPAYAESDLNCVLPLDRLLELEEAGEIGSVAKGHYSTMGYILQPEVLLGQTVPAIVAEMQAEAVDVLLLAPA
ncbi:glycine/sarcosine/betaine reductase selenoprotein B family protein [Chloroflexota bacterium]